jgi:ABC-2 type transport system permease protein
MGRPLLAILWVKWRMFGHNLASVRNESVLKVSVVSVSAAALWLGALGAFWRGFEWLKTWDLGVVDTILISELLMARLLSVFAFALFLMLIFSNTLIAFSTLYRSAEVRYLLTAPLAFSRLFVARFAESVVFSSWATAYLGSPLLLAYGISVNAPWTFYLATVLLYVPFVVVPAALGAMLAMAAVRVFPRLPRSSLVVTGAMLVLVAFYNFRRQFSSARLSENTLIPSLLKATEGVKSPLMPSAWLTDGILAAVHGDHRTAGMQFALLLSNALFFTFVAAMMAEKLFFPGWSSLLGVDRVRLKPLRRGPLNYVERALGLVANPVRSLVVKDIKLFWRDPTQWTQFVVFFGIMALYVANLYNRTDSFFSVAYKSWVAGLNVAACSLILATLTSRFVFPLISLEGVRFWILGLAPVTLRQIIWQKFWLSVATTSPFTVGLIILSNVILDVDALRFGLAVYSVVLANLSLAGLAVGLGALYPNFHEDNPARIVSGMGGTLNFLLSVGYIALTVSAQMVIMQWHVLERFASGWQFTAALAVVVGLITVISLVAVVLPMQLGLTNLENTEV